MFRRSCQRLICSSVAIAVLAVSGSISTGLAEVPTVKQRTGSKSAKGKIPGTLSGKPLGKFSSRWYKFTRGGSNVKIFKVDGFDEVNYFTLTNEGSSKGNKTMQAAVNELEAANGGKEWMKNLSEVEERQRATKRIALKEEQLASFSAARKKATLRTAGAALVVTAVPVALGALAYGTGVVITRQANPANWLHAPTESADPEVDGSDTRL